MANVTLKPIKFSRRGNIRCKTNLSISHLTSRTTYETYSGSLTNSDLLTIACHGRLRPHNNLERLEAKRTLVRNDLRWQLLETTCIGLLTRVWSRPRLVSLQRFKNLNRSDLLQVVWRKRCIRTLTFDRHFSLTYEPKRAKTGGEGFHVHKFWILVFVPTTQCSRSCFALGLIISF